MAFRPQKIPSYPLPSPLLCKKVGKGHTEHEQSTLFIRRGESGQEEKREGVSQSVEEPLLPFLSTPFPFSTAYTYTSSPLFSPSANISKTLTHIHINVKQNTQRRKAEEEGKRLCVWVRRSEGIVVVWISADGEAKMGGENRKIGEGGAVAEGRAEVGRMGG